MLYAINSQTDGITIDLIFSIMGILIILPGLLIAYGCVQIIKVLAARKVIITVGGVVEEYRFLRFLEAREALNFSNVDGYCRVICDYIRGIGRNQEEIHKDDYWFVNNDGRVLYKLSRYRFENIDEMVKSAPVSFVGNIELSKDDFRSGQIPPIKLSSLHFAKGKTRLQEKVANDSDESIYVKTNNAGNGKKRFLRGVFLILSVIALGIITIGIDYFYLFHIYLPLLIIVISTLAIVLLIQYRNSFVLTVDERNSRFLVKYIVKAYKKKAIDFKDVKNVVIDRREHVTRFICNFDDLQLKHTEIPNATEFYQALKRLSDKGAVNVIETQR